jgi:DNA-binding transcriptional MocR family regulator
MQHENSTIAARWRKQLYLWSDSWPTNGPEVSGRRRSSFRMLRACIGLVDKANASGELRGPVDWWTHRQLAESMHLSRNTAAAVLDWLQESGWLSKRARSVTSEGRLPDVRWLTLPNTQQSISVLSNGPVLNNAGSSAQEMASLGSKSGTPVPNGHIPALSQSVDTQLLSNVEKNPDVANATDEPADKPEATRPVTPQDIARQVKERRLAKVVSM